MSYRAVRESIGQTLYRQIGRVNSQIQKTRSLPVDLLENDDSYLVIFDTPGAEKDDVQVRYLDGTVRIRIDRFRTFYERCEMRFPGRSMELNGEVELPDDAIVDPDAATAHLSEVGTLKIDIPKPIDDEPAEAESETARAEEITIDD